MPPGNLKYFKVLMKNYIILKQWPIQLIDVNYINTSKLLIVLSFMWYTELQIYLELLF